MLCCVRNDNNGIIIVKRRIRKRKLATIKSNTNRIVVAKLVEQFKFQQDCYKNSYMTFICYKSFFSVFCLSI